MSARRESLLDLAELILERDGLEGFGVNALARAAGVKPPSLYKHFAGAVEIEHALVARWFRRLAAELAAVEIQTSATVEIQAGAAAEAQPGTEDRLTAFAGAYRGLALRAPQLYRLANDRTLDRELLERLDHGCEAAAMGALLRFFDEDLTRHDRARLAWAAAHGLVSLEIVGRFPEGADLASAWGSLARLLAA
ncbi:TetR/AcrR family transcriptional regulator [Leucobacter soli]|uniref:HTH tetR-type domain-containing protein n=1 Tax=Leucobacter soli TaxID=2812850 RepID=A0A916JTR8_9MICO|nr:TetR/AcrR family transcriptional regulator [Leucobacter soli]CAG7598416.1 hypothetical protein LEUCIP111803_00222 [Leucobacter soli]